ncbi:MAG: hypothetical protein GXY07_16145 [Candidatus Hydrogenedentes bacterium]|nr:hypothetical protein [Candidatus Hydrogenedentota bacterium]
MKRRVSCLCLLILIAAFSAAETVPLPPARQFPSSVEVVCVDTEATGYATFQSHNQKVVANSHGIFMSYIRTRDDVFMAQQWRLLRSTDGGRSFSVIYEDTHATNPPVLETDETGNIYLMRVNFQDGNAYLYRFLAEKGFQEPLISVVPQGAAGKYAMRYDPSRKQLYFFSHNNTFHVIGLDGTVHKSCTLLQQGPHAVLQYPYLDVGQDGMLHAAWTTQKHDVYLYYDIHHMCSPDGGKTWRNLDGAPLTTPVVADDTGPAMCITWDDEFENHTWLSSVRVKNGKLHFVYLAQRTPSRQHYMRYDIAAAKRDMDLQPEFAGGMIRLSGLDGFFAARSGKSDSPLFCVMQDAGRIACLVSRDNGGSWQDFARSTQAFRPYAIGGYREITEEGHVIGSFTEQGSPDILARDTKVFFFRIKTDIGIR